MIDRPTIERILDAAQITEVVQEFVHLKKRGVNYLGLCPFHNEKTPSFTVSLLARICNPCPNIISKKYLPGLSTDYKSALAAFWNRLQISTGNT